MDWTIKFTKKAQKQIKTLDKAIQSQIKKAILSKLMISPSIFLKPLSGDMAQLYKFRVGNYRLICKKNNKELIIIIVEVGHRKEIYKPN